MFDANRANTGLLVVLDFFWPLSMAGVIVVGILVWAPDRVRSAVTVLYLEARLRGARPRAHPRLHPARRRLSGRRGPHQHRGQVVDRGPYTARNHMDVRSAPRRSPATPASGTRSPSANAPISSPPATPSRRAHRRDRRLPPWREPVVSRISRPFWAEPPRGVEPGPTHYEGAAQPLQALHQHSWHTPARSAHSVTWVNAVCHASRHATTLFSPPRGDSQSGCGGGRERPSILDGPEDGPGWLLVLAVAGPLRSSSSGVIHPSAARSEALRAGRRRFIGEANGSLA
jgi:hypothetical protein